MTRLARRRSGAEAEGRTKLATGDGVGLVEGENPNAKSKNGLNVAEFFAETPTEIQPERRRLVAKTIRLRDKMHCKFVARQPCVVCGRTPSEAHHIRFAQPRALGRKVSDEYTVPICRTHHRELHRYGDEVSWWAGVHVDPVPIALDLWGRSHTNGFEEAPGKRHVSLPPPPTDVERGA